MVVNDPILPRRDLDPTNPSYYDNTADKNGDYNNKVHYTISKFVVIQTIKISHKNCWYLPTWDLFLTFRNGTKIDCTAAKAQTTAIPPMDMAAIGKNNFRY